MCEGTSVARSAGELLGLDQKTFVALAIESGLMELQRGLISMADFIGAMSRQMGQKVPDDIWSRFFKPTRIAESYALVEELKKDHRVVAGTNTIEAHYQMHDQQGDYEIFHEVYASHHIHLAKPDPAFLRWILDKEGFLPEHTIFIDDTEKNVISASSLGIYAIRFHRPDSLKKELRPFV